MLLIAGAFGRILAKNSFYLIFHQEGNCGEGEGAPLYLFIFLAVLSSFLRGLLSSCGEGRLLSSYGVQAPHCVGFSCCTAQALGTWA